MSDYSTLAQRVCSSISGIRGCLMLSRDGMVLGAHPEGEAEAHLKTAWVRFASLGDPDRSYVEYPDQTWGFVRRGGYAAFSVADAGIRPGVLVDLLEQVLMTGEQERADDRSALRLPEAPSAPSGKPRTSLHKPERIATPPPETSTVAPTIETRGSRRIADRDDAPASDAPPDGVEAVPIDASEVAAQSARAAPAKPAGAGEEESEVDRILLAKEFAGLLQVPKDDDEASR
jgi:hypothetical protein